MRGGPINCWSKRLASSNNLIGAAWPDPHAELLAGLSSRAIIRFELDGEIATEVERFDMGARLRSVVQGPEGNLWMLEDDSRGSQGRLLKLTPKD